MSFGAFSCTVLIISRVLSISLWSSTGINNCVDCNSTTYCEWKCDLVEVIGYPKKSNVSRVIDYFPVLPILLKNSVSQIIFLWSSSQPCLELEISQENVFGCTVCFALYTLVCTHKIKWLTF